MSDIVDSLKKGPSKDNFFIMEGGVPNYVGVEKQKKNTKAKNQEQLRNDQLTQQSVAADAQSKYAADQAAADAAAQDKLIAMRQRKQNRSGTLLTNNTLGAQTLG